MIEEVFGFDYRWEVYKPVAQRRYGYYVARSLRRPVHCSLRTGQRQEDANPHHQELVVGARGYINLKKCDCRECFDHLLLYLGIDSSL